MLPNYSDITDKLGPPLWWDKYGVPRYEPFEPRMCGVYDRIIIYYRIKCQDCEKQFNVTSSWDDFDKLWWYRGTSEWKEWNIERTVKNGLHYGDPPRHDCPGAGETMNCEDLLVWQAWECYSAEAIELLTDRGWKRHPELEGPIR